MFLWGGILGLLLGHGKAVAASPKPKTKLSASSPSKARPKLSDAKKPKVAQKEKTKSLSQIQSREGKEKSPLPVSASKTVKESQVPLAPQAKPGLPPPAVAIVGNNTSKTRTNSAQTLPIRNLNYNRSSASDLTMGSYHCISLDQGFPKCGTLIDVTPQFAVLQTGSEIIKLNFKTTTPTPSGPARGPASVEEAVSKTKSANSLIGLGVDYIFPTLQYQFGLATHFSFSVKTMLMDYEMSPDLRLKGFGGFLTLNYYGDGDFSGAWLELGAGRYSTLLIKPEITSEKVVFAAVGHFGWRWRWENGWSFAFGAGAQYLFDVKTAANGKTSAEVLPSLALDLGFLF